MPPHAATQFRDPLRVRVVSQNPLSPALGDLFSQRIMGQIEPGQLGYLFFIPVTNHLFADIHKGLQLVLIIGEQKFAGGRNIKHPLVHCVSHLSAGDIEIDLGNIVKKV
jgi:hypothetical protein